MLSGWMDGWVMGDTPQTVMTTRAPAVLKRKTAPLVDPATMATIESMIEQRVGGFSCIKCGYTSKRISNVKDHIERKHIEGMEYPCTSCDKVFRSSNAIRIHKIKKRC